MKKLEGLIGIGFCLALTCNVFANPPEGAQATSSSSSSSSDSTSSQMSIDSELSTNALNPKALPLRDLISEVLIKHKIVPFLDTASLWAFSSTCNFGYEYDRDVNGKAVKLKAKSLPSLEDNPDVNKYSVDLSTHLMNSMKRLKAQKEIWALVGHFKKIEKATEFYFGQVKKIDPMFMATPHVTQRQFALVMDRNENGDIITSEGVIKAEKVSHLDELMQVDSPGNWSIFIAKLQAKINEKWPIAYPEMPVPQVDFPEKWELDHVLEYSKFYEIRGLEKLRRDDALKQTKTAMGFTQDAVGNVIPRCKKWGYVVLPHGSYILTSNCNQGTNLRLVLRLPESKEGSLPSSSSSSASSNLSSGKNEVPQN